MIRRTALAGLTLSLLAAGLVVGLTGAGAPAAAAGQPDGWSGTRTLTRTFTNADGSTYEFPSRQVTVKVDKTQDLRGRQRINVSWTGAQPSGARASNPYGENGLLQEYPVVVLQCRGLDDPTLPADQQISPETCWTSSVAQRSQVQASPSNAVWSHDLYAADADKGRLAGLDPFPDASVCPTADTTGYYTKLTAFRAANQTVYPACDTAHMPPEAAVGGAYPAAEVAAFTDLDGNGSVKFEVRSEVENESLGCSHTTACSVVVIPIMGVSCDQPASPPTNADNACRQSGNFAAGSSNFANDGVDLAVSPALWWAASNWRNRFAVPVSFGLPPDACDVLDPRAPTGFYGSELLARAALQWSPAYCLEKARFKFQHNQMSDAAGFSLMLNGGGAAAEVSSEHDNAGSDPVGYAPTAVTGFAVGYVADRPDNAGEYTRMRLTGRLLAKLLTQSYLGSDLGRGHPGIRGNPLSLNLDPEFRRLNPGLSDNAQEAAATVLSLSESSDVIETLTDYLAHDRAAKDFIAGKPDPWGMVVNPSYRDVKLPQAQWPLLDSYIPETANTCRQQNPSAYFGQLAAPVTSLRKVSDALLDAWPNVQTRCDFDQSTGRYKLGRVDRQNYGSRFMLGIVSLGDAARYGLRSAALESRPGSFVAPTPAALAKAVALAKPGDDLSPFTIDQADVRGSGQAYPGTMIVYTAARLRNLEKADARKVAQFIRVSTTEGQQPGSGNGDLPDGFLPIAAKGVTGKLYAAAQTVADAVAAQTPVQPTPTPSPSPTVASSSPGPGTTGPGLPGVQDPGGSAPSAAPSAGASPGPLPVASADLVPTAGATSPLGRLLLPLLLGLGILGGLVSGGVRLALRTRR